MRAYELDACPNRLILRNVQKKFNAQFTYHNCWLYFKKMRTSIKVQIDYWHSIKVCI